MHRLADATLHDVRSHPPNVAVLPWGATEPHNTHLPYATDNFQVTAIADVACERAAAGGARVVQLPTIPYGTQTNMTGFPLAMNLMPSTQLSIVRDLCESLAGSGVGKLLVLNGHGGNNLKFILRELMNQTPVKLFLCDWFGPISADARGELIEKGGGHADELETSLILHLRPDLVATNDDGSLRADAGAVRDTRFRAVNDGWVAISRPWHTLTTNSGDGDPHAATAEKGAKLLEAVAGRLAEFLVELSDADVDDDFPF